VIDYVTGHAYGRRHRLNGYAGLLRFYRALSELQLQLFERLPVEKLLIRNPVANWEETYARIERYLGGRL
jgi:hypothetical protein